MKIRGWLIIGPGQLSINLPPAASIGVISGTIPKAQDYSPGTWFIWDPTPDPNSSVVLMCVEIPL